MPKAHGVSQKPVSVRRAVNSFIQLSDKEKLEIVKAAGVKLGGTKRKKSKRTSTKIGKARKPFAA